jgi:hypothetical protein
MRSMLGWLLGACLAAGLACPAAFADDQLVPTLGPLHGGHGAPPVITAPQPNCPTPLPNLNPSVNPPPVNPPPVNPQGNPAAPPANVPNPFDPVNRDLAEARGTEGLATGADTLLGDLAGGSYFNTIVHVPVTTIPFPGASPVTRISTRLVRVQGVNRGSFKITENESPRPLDRVFINYNYYNRLGSAGGDVTIRPDLHRETAGFEKTFLDGNASFGVRVPYLQTTNGDGASSGSDIGDITFIGKFAFYNDRSTGNLLSAGLAVTAPTGPDDILADGSRLHSTLLQPYLGYIWTSGDFYVQGFSAVIVPTDSRDVTLLTNDLGVGYRLYRNNSSESLITELTPTVEGHLTNPLNHRGLDSSGDVGFPDIFVLTTGVHVGVGRNAVLTTGFAVPLTGPKPFDFEGIVQFNFRF